MTSHNEPSIVFHFENVPIRKMDESLIPKKMDKLFVKLIYNDFFDMNRMKMFIDRYKLKLMNNVDNVPHQALVLNIITHFLYGNDQADLDNRLNIMNVLNQLRNEEMPFWRHLIYTYFLGNYRAIVCGIPSLEKLKILAFEEKLRVRNRLIMIQREILINGFELPKVKKEPKTLPPKDFLTSFQIPNIECIKYHGYNTYSTTTSNQHNLFKITNTPIYVEVDDINSHCLYMNTFINTKDIPMNLRLYLPILIDMLMEGIMAYDDDIIDLVDITDKLKNDLTKWTPDLGLLPSSKFMDGNMSSVISLFIQLDPIKFDLGIKWIHNFLFNLEINKLQFTNSLLTLIHQILIFHEHGDRMISNIMCNMIYSKDSNFYACGIWKQLKFLTELLDKIEMNDGWDSMNEDLNNLKLLLTNSNNLKMHISTDIDVLCVIKPDALSTLDKLLPPDINRSDKLFQTVFDYEYVLPIEQCRSRACAVSMDNIHSSYFLLVTNCVCDYNHPDLAALLVFLAYFTRTKGPLWKSIFGPGRTSSYNISFKPDEALIKLYFAKSSKVSVAYRKTKSVMEQHLDGSVAWSQLLFDTAKCLVISDVLERESTIGAVVQQSIMFHFQKLSPNYNRKLLKRISEVTLDELPGIGKTYVLPLFDPNRTRTALVCPPSGLKYLVDEFKTMGIDMAMYESLDECFLDMD